MKSRVHPKYKTKYRVTNWPEYERSLVQRGDITLWISAKAIDAWRPRPSRKRGGQRKFSDLAIETALIVFHLPLRQAEGFLRSVLDLINVDLEALGCLVGGVGHTSYSIACNVLNRMGELSRPVSVAIGA